MPLLVQITSLALSNIMIALVSVEYPSKIEVRSVDSKPQQNTESSNSCMICLLYIECSIKISLMLSILSILMDELMNGMLNK